MRTCALAMFVKTPALSPIKTRLADSIGRADAEEFYSLSVMALKSSVASLESKNPNITPFFAVAESEGLRHPLWQDWKTLHQGDGDLGTKLSKIYNELIAKFDTVLIIGSDSPQIGASDLEDAFEVLYGGDDSSEPILVVGPARDGGFYLVGSSARLPGTLWSKVRYSTENAGKDLIDAGLKLGEVITLPEETDVDTVQDLRTLAAIFPERSEASTAHKALQEWLTLKSEPNQVSILRCYPGLAK